MPLVDMPLKELKEYKGINPKPADFDEYWNRALSEMNALNPKTEITESDFQVPGIKCYDMYFDGTRGGRVYSKLLVPDKINGKAPAVLCFHGYSGYSGDWSSGIGMAEMGFVVAAMDCRGQGGKSSDRTPVDGNTYHGHIIRGLDDKDPDNMYFRNVFLDTALLAKIIMGMEEVDETRVAVRGGSQGGALTMACASLVPGIKLAIPAYPFLSDYKRVWDMDLAEDAYAELKEYLRHFDPLHEREDEIFTKLGYIDIHNLADRIKARVVFATGLMDTTCPPSTQFAVYNNINSEKELVIYPDFGHEGLPGFDDRTIQELITLL